ncbi:MAG: hypothetical protein IRZ16_23505 [Myxococcaceae bacterium]|nr:hypothetical protein [Myxococcaceae bacterium]
MRRLALLAALLGLPHIAVGQADKKPLPVVHPPLGLLGTVVDPPEPGGVPAGEVAVRAQFEGCPEVHTYYVSRALLLGAAGAGEKLSQWLAAQPALKKRLYGARRDPLAEAVIGARESVFTEGRACRPEDGRFRDVALAEDGRLTTSKAPPSLCKLERGSPDRGGVWLFTRRRADAPAHISQRDFAAAVLLWPPPPGAKKPCLPRLSVALFDRAGVTRLRYHADYNGAVEIELPGDRCTRVLFTFDARRQVFVPTVGRDPACASRSSASPPSGGRTFALEAKPSPGTAPPPR